jgi:hypothetical protein
MNPTGDRDATTTHRPVVGQRSTQVDRADHPVKASGVLQHTSRPRIDFLQQREIRA